ncbi:B12-binding domain-containing radical SAM protein [Candidatus Woesearchaeota archaeon]|nr:B12-binding domain-containing radical SAM protein [Candidatus Woesearchaeota archaeon]
MFTKKNKVLFIIHDVYQEDNQFPLGPGYLAAVLNDKGAYVESYCMDIFHYTHEQLAEHLQKNEYDLICLGFLAARFKETVLDLSRVINQNKKNAWLVLGGHGPSPIPEYVLKTTQADVIAIGEAENTIVELLKCKISDGDLSEVHGIAYPENNEIRITQKNNIVKNLDNIPFPLWDIFPMAKYTTCLQLFNQESNEKSFVFLTSRGCVNRCNFCYRLEKGLRLRSISNIIEEFRQLYDRYGLNCYFFMDELFVLNKKRLLEFEKALKDANLKIKFSCNARVDIMDEEMVRILKRCGCQFINFGFESSDDNVLKLMNKNATVEQNIRTLEVVKKVGGIGMGLNFLWNNLGDSERTLKQNVALIKRYNTYDQCRTIRPVTPYPGSDLYYKLIELGKLKGPEDFFNRFINSDLILVNLMDMPDKEAYQHLLKANTELILDHYKHTQGDMEKANALIRKFKDLYEGRITNFRGARHYNKNEQQSK